MTDKLLKLKAKATEDVQVISAVLQDAIAPVCDMLYRPEDRNFIMVVHRLRHESAGEICPERICCAVNLRGVEAVQTYGIDLTKRSDMLDLLAIMPDADGLQFIFAGGAKLRLQLDKETGSRQAWSMIVEDFGGAWPASCTPCHEEKAG
ncbi:MAG: DUF2948 family protein [Pseudomonadota bacterium]|nr:DUF2948 family protein [Pseudomonadota bacterium]